MIFAELPLEEATGALLAHGLLLGGRRHPKGARIDPALCAAARAQGIERLWAARPEPGDIDEGQAAARLGAHLAGPGARAEPPVHGRVNLRARVSGLVEVRGVGALNARSEDVGIATLPPRTPVAEGALIATIKLIPFAIPGPMLEALCAIPARIGVQAFREGLSARLLLTRTGEGQAKVEARTTEVTAERLARLGIALALPEGVPHAIEPLAARLAAATEALLLVAGATATADRRDVVPAAIRAAGGEVLRVGMPVDPGNLLVLGRIGPRTVIGLPGCARSPRRNGLDLVIEAVAAGQPPEGADIARLGVGGLLEESGRPVPWGWAD